MKRIEINLNEVKTSEILEILEIEATKYNININSDFFKKYSQNFFETWKYLLEKELITAEETKILNLFSLRFRKGEDSWTDSIVLASESGLIIISIESRGKNILFIPYWRLDIDVTKLASYQKIINNEQRIKNKDENQIYEERKMIEEDIIKKFADGLIFYMNETIYELYPTFSFKKELIRPKTKDYTFNSVEMEEAMARDKMNKNFLFKTEQEAFINSVSKDIKKKKKPRMSKKVSSNVVRTLYSQKKKEEKINNLPNNELTKEIDVKEIRKIVEN